MKIAIVHDYLFQYGGAEKVVEKWLHIYPQAEVYTSFLVARNFRQSEELSLAINQDRIKTTWLQKWFGSPRQKLKKYFKHFFWLYPLVMSRVTIKNYDLVIISSTYCAKNIHLLNCGKIFHYCHSPTRFLHGLVTETDHQTVSPLLRWLMPIFKAFLRPLDLRAVDYLNRNGTVWFSNSRHIQEVVRQVYHTESEVLYPPVQINHFLELPKKTQTQTPYYYYFGRVSFHKRIDLAILACLELNRKFIITGASAFAAEMDKLKQIVRNYEKENLQAQGLIQFAGRSSDQERDELLAGAKAFLFPGKEDFGIAPIEALASGTPLVAYQAGGALEYVQEGLNGVFFAEQTVESMKSAILKFETQPKWNPEQIRQSAQAFDEKAFEREFRKVAES